VLALWVAIGCATGVAVAAGPEDASAEAEYERALSLTPNLDNGRRIYLTCAVCHRPEGWGTLDGTYPQIAGQLPSVIIKQLADIRARNRDNPIMYPFAVPRILGGAQEIADVAAYISRLPMTPSNGVGTGVDLAHGEALYAEHCAGCHGKRGEGDEREHIPAIWGQHFNYLARQFEWIKIGKRRNADAEMQKQIRGFSPRDTAAVLDYASRLRPPSDRLAVSPGWRNPDFPDYVRPASESATAEQH
jgi:cytochrome c553